MTITVDREPIRFVVGGWERFTHWCADHGVNSRNPAAQRVRQITRPEHVKGYEIRDQDDVIDLRDPQISVDVFIEIEYRRR